MENTINKMSHVEHVRLEKELFVLLSKYNVSKQDRRALLHHAFVLVGRQIELQATTKRVDEALLAPRFTERASRPKGKKATIGF